jgi:hypothetical protein
VALFVVFTEVIGYMKLDPSAHEIIHLILPLKRDITRSRDDQSYTVIFINEFIINQQAFVYANICMDSY